AQPPRENFRAPNRLKANVLPVNLIQLYPQILSEHAHQRIDLISRSLPILGRESVESERSQSQTCARIDRRAHRFNARAVPRNARLTTTRCPSSIAIHNDGYVPGQSLPIDSNEQLLVS